MSGIRLKTGGCGIQRVDVRTASRLFGCPDLGAWRAEKDRDEEEGGIGYRVHVDQALSKPVPDVTLDGAEESQDEEQDGAFGEEER